MNFVIKFDDVPMEKLTENSIIKWGITHRNGARNYSMRYIVIEQGGNTPEHSHFYEHEIFVLSGSGYAFIDGIKEEINPRDFLFIPGGKMHKINAKEKMEIICVVPIEAARMLLGD